MGPYGGMLSLGAGLGGCWAAIAAQASRLCTQSTLHTTHTSACRSTKSPTRCDAYGRIEVRRQSSPIVQEQVCAAPPQDPTVSDNGLSDVSEAPRSGPVDIVSFSQKEA